MGGGLFYFLKKLLRGLFDIYSVMGYTGGMKEDRAYITYICKPRAHGRMQMKVLQLLQDGEKSCSQIAKHIRYSRRYVSRILLTLLMRGDISCLDECLLCIQPETELKEYEQLIADVVSDPEVEYRLSDKYKRRNLNPMETQKR